MPFIEKVLDIFFVPRETQLRVRATSYEELISHKRPCVNHLSLKIFSILPYRSSLIRAFITEAKFHNSKKARQLLGRALNEFLRAYFFGKLNSITLVPIPLSAKRRRERGCNQVEEILKYALNELPVAVDTRILERIRDTVPQTTLADSDRQKNLLQAFRVRYPPNPDTLYIVIDDVFTTGATLSAANAAFVEAGVAKVYAITLAY